jgi:predicted nucleotidyltransferase
MGIQVEVPKDKIKAFCRRSHIHSLAFFGSLLRDDFRPGSDVDVLIEFEQAYRPGFMELVEMQEELRRIFGQKVDLVERQAVERSENYIRRRHILESVEPIYVAG